MEGRGVIAKLLLLAQEPSNQTFIARDEGCMLGLVASLVNIDPEVVLIASRTLQFLSTHPQNKKLLKDFPNLVENLLQASVATSNAKTAQFCLDTLDNIGVRTATTAGEEKEEDSVMFEDAWNSENATPNKANVTYSKFNIFVDDLDDVNCILAQRILIKIPGVISVSLDKEKGAAAIGTREKDVDGMKKKILESLSRAGLNGRLKARTIIVNEIEEEPSALEEVSVTSKSYIDENSGYLEEADYYGEKESAVTRWGPSSLEARLEQERREEELRAAQTGRILSKVSSALTTVSSWLSGW